MKIVSYTVTKNGLSGYLKETIKSLKPISDYILVSANTNSKDNTVDWSKQNPDINFTIEEKRSFPETPEWKIRKKAYDLISEKNPDADWLIAIDDDEILLAPNILRLIFSTTNVPYIGVKLIHMWKKDKYRTDGTWSNIYRVIIQNLNKKSDKQKFTKSKYHSWRLPVPKKSEIKIGSVVPFLHFGWYINQKDRIKKMERLREIDNKMREKGFTLGKEQKKHYDTIYKKPILKELPEAYKKWI